MPVYPQDIYREIDRQWLERTARGKPCQPLHDIPKVAASILKERSAKRERKRISKNGQLISDGADRSAPATTRRQLSKTISRSCLLEKDYRGPEAGSAATNASGYQREELTDAVGIT